MKVLRIVSELDFGGVEQVALNSFPLLQESVDLQVVVLKSGGKVADQLSNQGIPINKLNKNPRIPNFKLIRLIQKEIENFEPEVVHTQGAEANFHGILAASFEKVPRIIAEEIGIPHHHSFWKWIFRWVYSKAHLVIAISEAVKENIVGLGEVLPEKVKVIYNPIKSVQGSRLGVQGSTGSDFVFVTTCRLVPIKNLERLIEAFEGLVRVNPDKNLRLMIVGDGPERENLEMRIREKRLENRVGILGFQENVWPFLADSDAFILPSLQEGSSVSLAEAMAAGLPSIVTRVGGATEILGNSQSGLLIDPLDTKSIQSAMQQLIDLSPDERQAMGEGAKKEARRFSVDNYLKELLKIYANTGAS